MPFPSPRPNVPRDKVGDIVATMLTNPDVARIECVENSDGTFKVTPFRGN